MRDAKNGLLNEDILKAARLEGIDAERLRRLVAKGHVVIPHNPRHEFDNLKAIGSGMRVKINVNVGTSIDYVNIEEEIEKVKVALKYGADAIMDLSTGGDIDAIRKKIITHVNVPLGTVPIYQAGIEKARTPSGAVVDMTEDDMFNAIEAHAKDGVDFMTLHCGVTVSVVKRLKRLKRVTGLVSRGGAFMLAWMIHNREENPLYANFDYLLEMASNYEFTLSLGDGLRPGGIADATDIPQISELLVLGDLVRRAREAGVQAMVEGPGHLPLNHIEANVRVEKAICDGAPFYVLGPLVTDIFPGYDHIVGAIGGAIAALAGADFLCYVTPAEHLALPTVEDVKLGTIASKIAAHAVDITRGINRHLDIEMDKARVNLDWDRQFAIVFDKEKASTYRKRRGPSSEKVCSMCGDYCAIKMANDYMKYDDVWRLNTSTE